MNNLLKILIYVHLIRLNIMVVELPAVFFDINSLVIYPSEHPTNGSTRIEIRVAGHCRNHK